MNIDGSNQTRFTNDGASDAHPVWSTDSSKIIFYSLRDGGHEIYVMDAVDLDGDGNGDNLVALTTNSFKDTEPSW